MERETFIIAGLGNPGDKYVNTRHNMGWNVIDRLADRWSVPMSKQKLKGYVSEVILNEQKLVLVKPLTFMNLSGECISDVLNWYKVPADHLLVIYDDIDLPLGHLRMRKSGSAGTHNGMRSIIGYLPQGNFPRLRVGVGRPPEHIPLVDWVLTRPGAGDQQLLDAAYETACKGVEDWVKLGAEKAMQRCNAYKPPVRTEE